MGLAVIVGGIIRWCVHVITIIGDQWASHGEQASRRRSGEQTGRFCEMGHGVSSLLLIRFARLVC